MPIAIPNDVDVTCGIHGPMKFRFERELYECVGYDGEGCCTLMCELELENILAGKPLQPDSHLLPWICQIFLGRYRIVVKYQKLHMLGLLYEQTPIQFQLANGDWYAYS